MSDDAEVDPAEATRRIEQALERIAALAQGGKPGAGVVPAAAIAARLDTLIALVRDALEFPGGAVAEHEARAHRGPADDVQD